MSEEVEKFMHKVWNKEAKRYIESSLNCFLKEKIELPDRDDYLELLGEVFKNERTLEEEKVEQLQERIDKAIELLEELLSSTKGVLNDYSYHREHNKILIELLKEDEQAYTKLLEILGGKNDRI